jgi:hypothetical protein
MSLPSDFFQAYFGWLNFPAMHSNVKNKKSRKISCWCTATEKRYIEIRARKAGFSASEYLREMALRDYLKKPKTLPPEVLAFDGQLLQLAATLQPLARKRLDADELNALERATLKQGIRDIETLILQIKTYLQ